MFQLQSPNAFRFTITKLRVGLGISFQGSFRGRNTEGRASYSPLRPPELCLP
jgi:hypothetical protein